MSSFPLVGTRRLPIRPVRVNREHPLVKVLEHLWLPDNVAPIDKIRGLQSTGGASGLALGIDGIGRCMLGATAGGTFSFPSKDAYPFVIVAYGTMAVNNGWSFASLSGSGGYITVQVPTGGTLQVDFRRAFGVAKSLNTTATFAVGTPICVIVQVLSDTDYRIYVNGEKVTGTASFGSGSTWISSCGSFASSLNGRQYLLGFGSGLGTISDDLALSITREPLVYLPQMFTAAPFVDAGASSGLTITATTGDVQFAGSTAVVNRQLFITATTGDAQFAGSAATVNLNQTITGTVGDAQFAGSLATVDRGLSITTTVGDAQFEGQTASVTFGNQLVITGTVGDTQFGGAQASLSFGTTISAETGAALFEGLTASVSFSTSSAFQGQGNLGPSLGDFWKKPEKVKKLRRRLAKALAQPVEEPPVAPADAPVPLRSAITRVGLTQSEARELTALRKAVAIAEDYAKKRQLRRRKQQQQLLLM